jgi:hypothetical protein
VCREGKVGVKLVKFLVLILARLDQFVLLRELQMLL